MVKLLLKQNDVEVNSEDEYGHSPLLFAAKNGHERVVRLLLEHNDVEVNSWDEFGCSLL